MSGTWRDTEKLIEHGRLHQANDTLRQLKAQGATIFGLEERIASIAKPLSEAEGLVRNGHDAEKAGRNRAALHCYKKALAKVRDYPNLEESVKSLKESLLEAKQLLKAASSSYEEGQLKRARASASQSLKLDPDSNSCRALLSKIDDELKDRRQAAIIVMAFAAFVTIVATGAIFYLNSGEESSLLKEEQVIAHDFHDEMLEPDDNSDVQDDAIPREGVDASSGEPPIEEISTTDDESQPPAHDTPDVIADDSPSTPNGTDESAGSESQSAPAKGDWASIVKRAMPSIVSLRVYNRDDQQISSSTGFAIGDNRIVTCLHSIPSSTDYVTAVTQSGRIIQIGSILAYKQEHDLAVLGYKGPSLPSLSLVSAQTDQGAPVIAIGCPRTYDFSVSDGMVAGWRKNENAGGRSEVQYTAPTSPGNSGGPILDAAGNVVGVVSWIRIDEGSQNLNFAISYSHVSELLGRVPESEPIRFANRDEMQQLFEDEQFDDQAMDNFYDAIVYEYLIEKDYMRMLEIEKIDEERRRLHRNGNRDDQTKRTIRDLGKRREALMRRHTGSEPVLSPTLTEQGRVGKLVISSTGPSWRRDGFKLKAWLSESSVLISVLESGSDSAQIVVHGVSSSDVAAGDYVTFSGVYMALGVESYELGRGTTARLRGFAAIDMQELKEAEDRIDPAEHNRIRQIALQRLRQPR